MTRILSILALTITYAVPTHAASKIGCGQKNADPTYCAHGERRPVCDEGGQKFVWEDTRAALLPGQFEYLLQYGTMSVGNCGCIDATEVCESMGRTDCIDLLKECQKAKNAGGQFCMQNKWGGNTCY